MRTIATIVEGHGEVEALPLLLRRIATSLGETVHAPRPIRVKRDKVVKAGELERAVELAARQSRADGCILVLLDADSDCPKDLAPQLLQRAKEARPDRDIRVVLAKTEYEAWFLAAAESIAGKRGIDPATSSPDDPESIGSPKGWLRMHMPRDQPYSETLDQAALSAVFDLEAARSAPSFDKLWRDVTALLEAAQ